MSTPWREAAGDKATAEGYECFHIKQRGRKADCAAYLTHGKWSATWPGPTPIKAKTAPVDEQTIPFNFHDTVKATLKGGATITPASSVEQTAPQEPSKTALQAELVTVRHEEATITATNNDSPSKQPLQGTRLKKKLKGVLPNGRDAKGVGKFENWCGQVYPSDVAYPAWRSLTKTATDVANICRAKMGYEKYKLKKKDPVFFFTVAEAEKTYKITRPTFSKAITPCVRIDVASLPKFCVNLRGKRERPNVHQISRRV